MRRCSRSATCIVVALVASLSGCASRDDASRREFVERFVQSMASGTNFHLRFLEPGQEENTRLARAHMTREFEIVGWERVLWSSQYEYHLRFGNGATGTLFVRDNDGHERRAVLVVQESESQPPRSPKARPKAQPEGNP